jgi:hypothetical protein
MKLIIETLNEIAEGFLFFVLDMLWAAHSTAKSLLRFVGLGKKQEPESQKSPEQEDLDAFVEALHEEEMKLNRKHQGVK